MNINSQNLEHPRILRRHAVRSLDGSTTMLFSNSLNGSPSSKATQVTPFLPIPCQHHHNQLLNEALTQETKNISDTSS